MSSISFDLRGSDLVVNFSSAGVIIRYCAVGLTVENFYTTLSMDGIMSLIFLIKFFIY